MDLADHLTTHRAQGQTPSDCLISVNMGIDKPDAKLVDDEFYFVCRNHKSYKVGKSFGGQYFSLPIFGKKLGRTSADESCHKVELSIKNGALKFAKESGTYREAEEGIELKSDQYNTEDEWTKF